MSLLHKNDNNTNNNSSPSWWWLGITSAVSVVLSLTNLLLTWRLYQRQERILPAFHLEQQQDNNNHSNNKSRQISTTSMATNVPPRFLRAAKGDPEQAQRRYQATLDWRHEHDMDTCLQQAWPQFHIIKQHYPHYFHGTSRKGQPVFVERPPHTNLKALRDDHQVTLSQLLHHYAMVTEFQWQYLCRDDEQTSVYIIDLQGVRMGDFVGECQEFVRQASAFTSAHYPERAGVVLVLYAPYWFTMIWNVVKQWVDDVTLAKIQILGSGPAQIYNALLEYIDDDGIPQEYGGTSPYQLGASPQEDLLRSLMEHNNTMAAQHGKCPNQTKKPCQFCTFEYARNY